MSNNLTYGGIIYPDNSFVFDKIYNSFKEANDNVNTDTVLVGRYILVAYCDTAFTQDERNKIMVTDKEQKYIGKELTDEQKFWNNFFDDGKICNDRKVYRKIYKNNTYSYQEIAQLNSGLSDNSITVRGVAAQEANQILSLSALIDNNSDGAMDGGGLLSTTLKIQIANHDNSTWIQLIGVNDCVISEIDADDFIADGVLGNVEFKQDTNELLFTWNVWDAINDEYITKTKSIKLDDILQPYIAGNGIAISNVMGAKDAKINIQIDPNSEKFLSVGASGLKLSGIQNALDSVKNQVKQATSYADLGSGTNIGDIGIVTTPIATGKTSYTAYVWNGTAWAAMDGNYNADNVYFDEDLITSFAIGNYTLSNGMATIPAAGKNLNEIWQAIYVKEINTSLQKTQPSCTMSGNSIKYYLVGATSETRTITLGLDKGAYDYGYGYITSKDETDPATGTPAKTRVTNDGAGVVPVASSPYTLTWDGTTVQPTATNGNVFSCTGRKKTSAPAEASVIGKVKYEKAGNPVSNLGNIYPAQAYSNNTSNANTQVLARWYYPFYQGFTVDSDVISSPGEITGAQLEALNKNNMLTYRFSDDATSVKDSDRPGTTKFIDANAYSKKKVVKAIAQNPWRQYFIAYPKSYGYVMSNAKDGNNIDCTVKQAKDITLTFNGVNVVYSVYYINNATPYGTKTITWTLN